MLVTIDFETAYSTEYSLSRMSEVGYILDPRFEIIMCSIKIDNGATEIHIGFSAVAARFKQIDWSRVAVLSHNMRFDGAILFWIFGITPKAYCCTLSMARALTHNAAGGSSLAKVAKYLGLPAKGTAVVNARGKWLRDFSASELQEYADYCVHDADLCHQIFQRFVAVFPRSELSVVDITMRMFIEPQTRLNMEVLAVHLNEVRARKQAIMAKVAVIDKSVFSSNQKFAALLEAHGVEVPMKESPATGELIPALALGDREFKELRDDDSQPLDVQLLLAARVGAKSTLEETRTDKMLALSLRSWPDGTTGWCPVPLKYYGAHTGRFSGDGGFNFQNFKRHSRIKEAIEAPAGMALVHRDSSQIEARMVAWMSGCTHLLLAFAEGRDIYSEFATAVYGRIITRADKSDRFVGKTSILGLGYGMGAERFMQTLFIGAGGISRRIDEQEAVRIVDLYRATYPEIPTLWRRANAMLHHMVMAAREARTPQGMNPPPSPVPTPGPAQLFPAIEWSGDALWLPNGLAIQYPGLDYDTTTQANGLHGHEIRYTKFKGRTKLFGGKAVENVSQALSRIVITDAMRRIKADTGYSPFLTTHDSLDYCVPEGDAAAMNTLLEAEFAVRPSWAPTLPLASEGGYGKRLTDAELGV